MSLCDRCKNKCKFMLKNKTLDACGLFEPATNFDRITKTPEALADFISKATIAAWFAQVNGELPKPNGSREWLEWLKQESE